MLLPYQRWIQNEERTAMGRYKSRFKQDDLNFSRTSEGICDLLWEFSECVMVQVCNLMLLSWVWNVRHNPVNATFTTSFIAPVWGITILVSRSFYLLWFFLYHCMYTLTNFCIKMYIPFHNSEYKSHNIWVVIFHGWITVHLSQLPFLPLNESEILDVQHL